MARSRLARNAAIGLGAFLAVVAVARSQARAQDQGTQASPRSQAKVIHYKDKAFRIPVAIPQEADGLVRQVRLWVSDDFGYHWKEYGHTTPDRPEFPFRATRDGEYWFAIQTVDTNGRVYPADDRESAPSLRVVVDTAPPTVALESQGRRGSRVGVRWEIQDEHLNPASFSLEYQPEGAGAREWRSVPLRETDRKLAGSKTWDAGTSEPLRVRATVSDRAKNVRQVEIAIPDGIAASPGAARSRDADLDAPPPVNPISSRSAAADNPFSAVDDEAEFRDDTRPAASAGGRFESDTDGGNGSPAFERSAAREPVEPGRRDQTLLVGNPRFPLQYQVDGTGPGGVAKVQLWVTHDAGRTWYPQPEDPDRQSPYPVTLSGEGTFGLWLSVQGTSGLGDPPPAPGDSPQMWVEVDSTPPVVQVDPPRVGTRSSAGKVLITWRASDPHLGSRPVTLSYRADDGQGDWVRIAGPIENNGQYVWTVPPGVPPRFRVRVEVDDTLAHRGVAESAPILVDRARPKGRIIGLDPSAHFNDDEARR
jgi:hypothetical protein